MCQDWENAAIPTLISELIDIPERVHRGDFVLKLAEGLARPEETVRNYVATPQLVTCFDAALSFIRSEIETRSRKAAYLHGSFGACKSHFMAVLDLVLAGNPAACSMWLLGELDELAAAALFLASDQAAYITGETLGVSGGMGIGA